LSAARFGPPLKQGFSPGLDADGGSPGFDGLCFIMTPFNWNALLKALAKSFYETMAAPQNGLEKVALWQRFDRRQPFAGISHMRAEQVAVIGENLTTLAAARDADVKLLSVDGGQ